jgi:hypothetical protein
LSEAFRPNHREPDYVSIEGWLLVGCRVINARKTLCYCSIFLPGGCPRIAIVARARLVERDFSIIWGE